MAKYIISLGSTCSIAFNIEKYGLRRFALPFDWLRTDMVSIIDCLEDQFNSFNNWNKAERSPESMANFPVFDPDTESYPKENGNVAMLYINGYGMKSFHDFDGDNLEIVKEKYKRRIERFITLLQSDNHILFIRDELKPKKINQELVDRFHKVIKAINPHLIYALHIIVHHPKTPMNIQNCTVTIDTFQFIDWKRENLPWLDILFPKTNYRIKTIVGFPIDPKFINQNGEYNDGITDPLLCQHITKYKNGIGNIAFMRSNRYDEWGTSCDNHRIRFHYFNFDYWVSPDSFTTVNPYTDSYIHKLLEKWILGSGIVDCLGGQMGIFLKRFKERAGIGLTNSEAIYNDAIFNGIDILAKVDYEAVNLKKYLKGDILIINISKKGLRGLVEEVKNIGYKQIIYFGCHKESVDRDISSLSPQYRIIQQEIIDSFPGTDAKHYLVNLYRC